MTSFTDRDGRPMDIIHKADIEKVRMEHSIGNMIYIVRMSVCACVRVRVYMYVCMYVCMYVNGEMQRVYMYTKQRRISLEIYFTGWESTVHVSRCPALYSGRIFVPLCRELIIFVF